MGDPLVSVIVPLYNYKGYIGGCIKSVLNQDYENFELIVCDDHSTDSSYEVAQSFQSPKVKVIQLKINRGYSVAKNKAIQISQGQFITCLDADDMFTKNSLSCRVDAMRNMGLDLVHANAINVSGDISLKACYQLKPPYKRDTPRIHAQTVMLDRKVHIENGLYDENLRSRADKEMWIRLFGMKCAGNHLCKKGFIKNDVAYYRKHKKSMMSKRRRNPALQKQLTQDLYAARDMRLRDGIHKSNTKFLEA